MSLADEMDPHAFAETGSIRRIASDIWRIVAPNPSPLTGPGTNTYVVGALRRIVIDPGPADPVHIQRILDVTGGEVGSILCTHSHPDHVGGNEKVGASGAPISGRGVAVVGAGTAARAVSRTAEPPRAPSTAPPR